MGNGPSFCVSTAGCLVCLLMAVGGRTSMLGAEPSFLASWVSDREGCQPGGSSGISVDVARE